MPDDQPFFPATSLAAEDLAADRGARRIFAGVSFALSNGDALAIRGPNGIGKSTLLRLLAGLMRPAAGRIQLTPASDAGLGPHAHYLGHADALKASLSVGENLAFYARLWGGKRDVIPALEAVGIADLADLPAAVLSAGQRRRAALARLQLSPRPIWLLDEPTASLDAAGEVLLGRLVADHLRRGGIAIMATHVELPVPPTHLLTLGGA